jgi:hypothetical protein
MHQPLILDPRVLRPLPQSLWGHACSKCDKTQSVWELFAGDPSRRKGEPICSMCWLYESEWGQERRADIDQFIREVEVQAETIFRKTLDGRLWSCKDADRIVGAVAVTSRIATQRAMLRDLGGGDGS